MDLNGSISKRYLFINALIFFSCYILQAAVRRYEENVPH